MGLELRQNLKLTQQLVMTPQLQQAIKLLQLSRVELLDAVQQELLENPLLEEGSAEPDKPKDTLETPQDKGGEEDQRKVNAEEAELLRNANWDDYLGAFSSSSKQAQMHESEVPEEMMSYEARFSGKPSLEGHLLWQMRLSDLDDEKLVVGEAILGSLDNLGYLSTSLEEIAQMTLSPLELVEEVHDKIMRMDPVGVAARNPQECLLVQLDLHGESDQILLSLVRDHLEDLEKRRYKPLMRKFKIRMEDIKAYLDLIQQLDPMPGASYGSEHTVCVSPDVFVYKYEDDFVIVMNEDGLPKLQLNPFYMDNVPKAKGDDREYMQEKMRSAMWLMKSLHQRQRTLFKVVESIVKFQHDFFEHGVTKLNPLILKDVADDIEMHESTVSRITTSKYVATPFGVFELKFFFNSALGLDDGSQVGSESVKAVIKRIIGEEEPRKPYSDEKISSLLKEELDVNIARRTVAKYRVALGIASSSKRKQIF